ncbi:ScyD/ScyE family protein [Geodermatophilus sp. SYSU D00703]
MRTRRSAVVGAAALALVTVPAAAAGAQEGVTTVAGGLDGPRQVAEYSDGRLLVAESDTGEVSSVDPSDGTAEAVVTGLVNPQGVGYRDGEIWIAAGETGPPEEGAPPPPPEPPAVGQGGPGLLVTDTGGEVLRTIDTLAYELENNPDGQTQFVDGAPVDALSNPFALLVQRDRVLVADAGANTVLSVDRESGEISTFFVPPVIGPDEVAACGETPNNPGTVGCDPVPTGVARGPDGRIYVSTLGAEVPDAARVYVLSRDGEEVDVLDGFTSLTGVEVDREGTVTVSELLEGLPEGEPGPDFDPATVGQLIRVDGDERTYAQVTMPTGLLLEDGELYASAWSIAGFVGLPARGEVVRVADDAFAPAE